MDGLLLWMDNLLYNVKRQRWKQVVGLGSILYIIYVCHKTTRSCLQTLFKKIDKKAVFGPDKRMFQNFTF